MNVCLFDSVLSLFVLCSEIIRIAHESSKIALSFQCTFDEI